MDFFKSVFSDEPDSPQSESKEQPDPDPNSPSKQPNQKPRDVAVGGGGGGGGGWSFGGLLKTISTKSESVIEIYRRDLKEFSSGLRKEIEVAQGSLETVGHAIDELGSSVLKGTVQMISHGKEAILAVHQESDSSDNNNNNTSSSRRSLSSKRYSRFDAQVRAIQGDPNTYREEAEDLEDYKKWKLGFGSLEEKREEIQRLLEENGTMESIYKKVVPNSVDEETFWRRYYYRVYKLKQAEDTRANLVKRAISSEEDELSWDVDDDDDEEEDEKGNEKHVIGLNANVKGNEDMIRSKDLDSTKGITKHDVVESNEIKEVGSISRESDEKIVKSYEDMKMDSNPLDVEEEEEEKSESKGGKVLSGGGDNAASDGLDEEKSKDNNVSKFDEKGSVEGKGDNGGSSKDSDFSVVSSHPSMPEEEDLGWDEIEDLSSFDEKKVSHSGSPSANKVDLRKRLSSAAQEEEDLSWDIEDDDDEPMKD